MKTSRSSLWPVAAAFAFLGLTGTLSAVQVTITGSDLPAPNTVSTWTSTDGKLTLNAWADAAKTTPANLSRSLDGNFIGVFDGVNDNALDSGPDREEQLEIVLAADAGLAAFEVSYASTQANTTLSGFTENPGVIFSPNGGDGGIATYD